MSRSPSRSATSLAALAGSVTVAAWLALGALAGCGDDDCGPGGAPEVGLTAEADSVVLTYGHVTSRLGNDCPTADAPAGVISLTIEATQTDGTGRLTLCVGRPDLLAQRSQTLGSNLPGAEVRLIDLNGTASGCSYAVDTTQLAAGDVRSSGMCGNGGDAAGFALTLNGSAVLKRTCGANVGSIDVVLHGGVAVLPAR
jgi:hypothetical protein